MPTTATEQLRESPTTRLLASAEYKRRRLRRRGNRNRLRDGLAQPGLESLTIEERADNNRRVSRTLLDAGAHAVVRSVAEFRPDTLWKRFGLNIR